MLFSYTDKKKWNISILVEFEVFTKCCYLNRLLAIPMLQIVIKHLKWTLFIHFLRRTVFSLLDDCCCSLLLLLQSTAFQLCEYLYWILHDMSPNQWNVIFKPMLMTTKQGPHRWLTFAKRVHKTCLSESAQSPYKVYYCEIWLGKIHTCIMLSYMNV